MATQSVVVSRRVAASERQARAIAKRITGREPRTVRKTTGSYRFRQFPPEQCVRAPRTKVIRPGVSLVVCLRRGEKVSR